MGGHHRGASDRQRGLDPDRRGHRSPVGGAGEGGGPAGLAHSSHRDEPAKDEAKARIPTRVKVCASGYNHTVADVGC